MPRPGPRRPLMAVRVEPDHITYLHHRAAAETGGNLSEFVRRIVEYSKTMPTDWRGHKRNEEP